MESAEIELGSVDQIIEDIIKFCCVQIIIRVEKYNNNVPCTDWRFRPKSSTCNSASKGCPDPHEQQIEYLEYLSETISLTDAEINNILEVIWDWSREEMVAFLWEEIFQVIVSVLSSKLEERGRSQSRTKGEKLLLSQFLPVVLETSLDYMVQMVQRNASWLICKTCILGNGTKHKTETPVTPRKEDKNVSPFRVSTVVKIKKKLDKVIGDIADYSACVNAEERGRVLPMIRKDNDIVANEIVELIIRDHKLDQDAMAKTTFEPNKETGWIKEAESKISALRIRSFTKMSVINLLTKLRGKHDCSASTGGYQSFLRLFDGVDLLVNKMLSLDEDQEAKKEVEECLYSRAAKKISGEWQNLIRKRLCALTLRHLNPNKGRMMCSRQEIQVEVNASTEEMVKWLNLQAKQHSRKAGLTWDTLEEIHGELANRLASAPSSKDQSDVRGKSNKVEATAKEDLILDRLCNFVVTMMVMAILKDYHFHSEETNAIVMIMKEMLLAKLAGCEIAVELNYYNTRIIIRAVKKALLRCFGNSELVRQAIWAKDRWVFHFIVEHLKKQLLKPVKVPRISKFLQWLSKPLDFCLQNRFQKLFIDRDTSFSTADSLSQYSVLPASTGPVMAFNQ